MIIKGSCHCGATQFEVTEAPASVTRCTCSLCSKRGALWAYYKPDQFRVTTSREQVGTYQWRTKTVQHHFCLTCGCGTYSESPDWSTGKADFDNPRIGVNARLLDDFDIEAVSVVDGKNMW
ncbi:MAG TPA: GFA family protein [Candidatus Binataceae bacterium]|nr:GFA family protein [Candidatus Binataceae bacterium]